MKRDSFRLLRVLFDANYKKKSKKEKEKKGEKERTDIKIHSGVVSNFRSRRVLCWRRAYSNAIEFCVCVCVCASVRGACSRAHA